MNIGMLEELLDRMPPEIVPGCSCEVRVGGETVFRRFHGFSDYELTRPASETDVYWLYSCSKVFTAVMLMRLIGQGKLGLYDPVDRYLPEFSEMTVAGGASLRNDRPDVYDPVRQTYVSASEAGPHPAANRMRIYDLIRMASGFSYVVPEDRFGGVLDDPEMSTRDFARALARTPLLFEPGTDFLYSFSLDVIGAVIETVSGKSFGEYLRTEVCEPLGMTHTAFGNVERVEDATYRLAAQYMMNDDQKANHPISGNAYLWGRLESGGGGLKSTLDDVSRFASVLANGGRTGDGYVLLSPESIDLMRSDHLDDRMKASFWRNWPHLINYSYGLGVRTFLRNADGNGGSVGEFGWEGAPGSYILIDPEKRISCVYMQHVRKCSYATSYVHRRLTRALYAD